MIHNSENGIDNSIRNEKSRISRRSFFAGLAGIFATYIALDQGLAMLNWRERQTEVKMLPEYENNDSEELWLVSPGLGVQSSKDIATALRKSLEINAPIAYLNISDEGLAIAALAEKTNMLCAKRKVKKINIFGNSMGMTTGLQIVNQLDVANLNLAICDGSPYDINDVRDTNLTAILKTMVEYYKPGFVSKFIGEAINSTVRDPNKDLSLLDQLKEAYKATGSGISPKVWADQLVLLGNIETTTYQEKITDVTKSAYLLPQVPNNDKVVDVNKASSRYNETFNYQMQLLGVDISRHASPVAFAGQYNDVLTAYLSRMRIN